MNGSSLTKAPKAATPTAGRVWTPDHLPRQGSATAPPCSSCQGAGNLAIQSLLSNGVIRAKLTVGQPDDPEEREADRIADALVSESPMPHMSNGGSAGRAHPCGAGKSGASGQGCGDEPILRKANPAAVQPSGSDDLALGFLQTGGNALDADTREEFERKLQTNFASVRVHRGPRAAEAAAALGARAFAVGTNIAFGSGQFDPGSRAGRHLLAHELTHVAQRAGPRSSPRIQRQLAPGGAATVEDKGKKEQAPARPPPGSEILWIGDMALAADRPFIKAQLRGVIARSGLGGTDAWVESLTGPAPMGLAPVPMGHLSGTGAFRPKTPLDAIRESHDKELRERIVPMVTDVYRKEVRVEAVAFIETFRTQAVANAEKTLQANEAQAKATAFKLGITSEQITKFRTVASGEGPRLLEMSVETKYSMKEDSIAGKALRDNAKVLLGRRREIEAAQRLQSSHVKLERDPNDPKGRILVPDDQYAVIGKEVQDKREAYGNLRTVLSAEHPALAAFSGLDQSTRDLETLAEKGPGADMGRVIGERIAEQIANIEKVRKGLADGDVNVWRQDKIVDLTRVQLGVADDPTNARLIADKVQSEQPGILATIALLVLNIAALLLAGPTGGLSLVVAAGVNIAAAAVHVEEYLMQSALSGTAFDKAQAISKEEPSLFWLAVEIVGTALDVGPAASALFKTFRTLAPLVKTARAAAAGEEALKGLQAVRTAATEAKGAEFAEKVVAQVKGLRKGESAVIEGARVTEEEAKLLQAAGRAVEAEAAEQVGKALKTATGEIHVSKAGHVFSCSSPCTELAEKYAEIFSKDKGLADELAKIESKALEAAKAQKAAEASKDAKALAKAEELANSAKAEAAGLEKRILDSNPSLVAKTETDAAVSAVRQAEAESAIAKGRYPSEPSALEKLKPVADRPPKGVRADDPMWRDYISYFNDRLEALKSGAKGAKAPLKPEEYFDFLGKFKRGTKYQEGVLEGLKDEAKLPAAERKLFGDMEKPIVESNVGVGGKEAADATTKFADQLVVDGATLGSGKTPNIAAFSNKSRVWPETLSAANRGSVRAQVVEDAAEALTKYGGEITLRRPDGPLKELFNQTVKVSKVTLVYDKALVKTAELEKLIVDAAKGVKIKGQTVTVIFR